MFYKLIEEATSTHDTDNVQKFSKRISTIKYMIIQFQNISRFHHLQGVETICRKEISKSWVFSENLKDVEDREVLTGRVRELQ